MAGPFTNFLIGQGKGVATSQGKNLTRAERKRLADRIASGEFIPKGNFPTEFNGQVNTNVRQPIDGEVVPQPSGLLNAPQGQIGADGVMITPPPARQGLLGAPAPKLPPPDVEPSATMITPPPPRQALLGAPNPPEIDPKTGRPYGQMAGTAGIVAGGGVLLGMDGNEGSANANLTPEQIQEDKDGRAQMIKDAEDIKSGAATPDQLLRATNFQRMEAAASGRPIEKINKPEGLDQGFWETLGGKFDMTAVGLALMASSANGQPFGANLGRALQVGVMSADSKKALSKADQTKADAEAKSDKIRTDALALAAEKYTATQIQQAAVNNREDKKVQIQQTRATVAGLVADNQFKKDQLAAANKPADTPTGNKLKEIAASAKSNFDVELDVNDLEDRHVLMNIYYASILGTTADASTEQRRAEEARQIGMRFNDNWRNSIDADPVRQPASAQTPAATAGANSFMINGVPITRN